MTYSSRLTQWVPTSPSVPPRPELRRIEAPGGLLLAELLVRHHQEVLQVLDDDLAHRAHRPGAEQFARVADQRMAGVVVRDREDEAGLLDELHQFLGLVQAVGHRLVADDVKAGIEECLGDREMRDVGRDDADEIDALVSRQLRFRCRHLLVGAIAAGRIEVELRARQLRVVV